VNAAGVFAVMGLLHMFAAGGPVSQKEFEAAVKAERQRYLKAFGADKFKAATGCNAVEGCHIPLPDWLGKGGS